MSLWRNPPSAAQLQERSRNSMSDHLGMRITEVGDDYVRVTMPVDARTLQPMGLLHGGASVALAETAGSLAALLCLDATRQVCVGQEINANHLRAMRSGTVTGTARPVHIGRRSHVWQIEIRDEQERLVCISRLTMAIIDREEPQP